MSFDRNKVLNIARAEIGYLEKSAAAYKQYGPSILYDKVKGAGADNYTKYGYELHALYPAVMDFPAAWCDCFVDWCFYKAYGISNAQALLGGRFDDYTVASAQLFANKNALNHTPEVGSQIFFSKNGAISGIYHTGIVESVSADGRTVVTIEGNTSASGSNIEPNGGAVARKTRVVSNNTFFGHPNYADSNGTLIAKNAESVATASSVLRKGDKGPAVKDMQTKLVACHYSVGPDGADGVFGENTRQSLIAYQKSHGLIGDGEYGPKTKAALQSSYNAITQKKSIDTVAREVMAGSWGQGSDRQNRLTAAGYDYNAVQKKVNEFMANLNRKSVDTIAREIIEGKWGVDPERSEKLEQSGYDPAQVQHRVNELLGKG